MQVGAYLNVNRDDIGASLGELLDILLRRFYHQMHIERELGVGADGGYHQRANGDIGHEVPVHDIYMYIIGTCPGGLDDLFPQPTEVGGKYGRGELDFSCH
jgi:hypothetical protein